MGFRYQCILHGIMDFGLNKNQILIEDFKFNVDGLSELVNWGIENNMYMIHHCLFFPNKYFQNGFGKQITLQMS